MLVVLFGFNPRVRTRSEGFRCYTLSLSPEIAALRRFFEKRCLLYIIINTSLNLDIIELEIETKNLFKAKDKKA